jgi:hypothetical protein
MTLVLVRAGWIMLFRSIMGFIVFMRKIQDLWNDNSWMDVIIMILFIIISRSSCFISTIIFVVVVVLIYMILLKVSGPILKRKMKKGDSRTLIMTQRP